MNKQQKAPFSHTLGAWERGGSFLSLGLANWGQSEYAGQLKGELTGRLYFTDRNYYFEIIFYSYSTLMEIEPCESYPTS